MLRHRRRRHSADKIRRTGIQRALLALVVVVSVLIACVVSVYGYAEYRFGQIHRVAVGHLAPVGGVSGVSKAIPVVAAPFNVLLVGSDSRAFVDTSGQASSFGSAGSVTGQRSDVIIIARVVPADHSVTLLSVPRDLWVDIPSSGSGVSGYSKINAAFNSGPDLLVQTIESQLGIPINHYASIDFSGFSTMVDSLGGINLNFPMPVRDAFSGLNITQSGCQPVSGAIALSLVRSRHLEYYQNGYWQSDGLSDFSRIQRQDVFFRELLVKAAGAEGNLFATNAFIGAVVPNLTLGSEWGQSQLLNLARQFSGFGSGDFTTETLPTTGFTTSDGQSALQAAQPYASSMIAQFLSAGVPGSSSTTVGSTPVTTGPPLGGVYTNTQPEPWNPTPC
jgi:LCP family protein required for cell wall assembly